MVTTRLQLSDPLSIDIESRDWALFPKLDGKWQAHIAKTKNGKFYFVWSEHLQIVIIKF
jgi:hypothetical protein